jgi:hypothetical protein
MSSIDAIRGVRFDVFSFITTTPNALVATVNHEISLLLTNGSAEEELAIVNPLDLVTTDDHAAGTLRRTTGAKSGQ